MVQVAGLRSLRAGRGAVYRQGGSVTAVVGICNDFVTITRQLLGMLDPAANTEADGDLDLDTLEPVPRLLVSPSDVSSSWLFGAGACEGMALGSAALPRRARMLWALAPGGSLCTPDGLYGHLSPGTLRSQSHVSLDAHPSVEQDMLWDAGVQEHARKATHAALIPSIGQP